MVSAWFPFKSPQNASIETKHFGQHQASTIAMAAATSTERSSSTQERWLKFISIGMGILHLKNVELELSNFHFVTLKCTMSQCLYNFRLKWRFQMRASPRKTSDGLGHFCGGFSEPSECQQLWPWLVVIPGYFSGIIHSINGVTEWDTTVS